jgi:hypothetical protein
MATARMLCQSLHQPAIINANPNNFRQGFSGTFKSSGINCRRLIEDSSLQVDLAIAQIVTTILITIGATLFAIGFGFDIAFPPIVQDILNNGAPANLQDEVLLTLDNYSFILMAAGILMMIVGVSYGSVRLSEIKRRLKRERQIKK